MESVYVANFVLDPTSALDPFLVNRRHDKEIDNAGVTIKEERKFLLLSLTAFKNNYEELSDVIFSKYGITLPKYGKISGSSQINLINIAPGQWLIYSFDNPISNFLSIIEPIVGNLGAIVDLSDARAIIKISGPKVRDTLAKGVSIDLHPRKFTPDRAVSTFAAQLGMTIWQSEDGLTFYISVFRAFGYSLLNWLITSASEFGYNIEI